MDSSALTAENYKAWVQTRENAVREKWVKAMELRINRESLAKCQKIEGVNHYEKCKPLAEKYADMLREAQITGIRNIDV